MVNCYTDKNSTIIYKKPIMDIVNLIQYRKNRCLEAEYKANISSYSDITDSDEFI